MPPVNALERSANCRAAGVPVAVMTARSFPGSTTMRFLHSWKLRRAGPGRRVRRAQAAIQLKDLFREWVERHFPIARESARRRRGRAGNLRLRVADKADRNRSRAAHLKSTFDLFVRRFGLSAPVDPMNCGRFRRPSAALSEASCSSS